MTGKELKCVKLQIRELQNAKTKTQWWILSDRLELWNIFMEGSTIVPTNNSREAMDQCRSKQGLQCMIHSIINVSESQKAKFSKE